MLSPQSEESPFGHIRKLAVRCPLTGRHLTGSGGAFLMVASRSHRRRNPAPHAEAPPPFKPRDNAGASVAQRAKQRDGADHLELMRVEMAFQLGVEGLGGVVSVRHDAEAVVEVDGGAA
jgi:hypothetical protein